MSGKAAVLISFFFTLTTVGADGAWVAGTVYMTEQDVALHYLRMPLPGFRVSVITEEGEVASTLTTPSGAFLVEAPAGERFYVRSDPPAEGMPAPFVPSASQYYTLDPGEVVVIELPMAAAILVDILPQITFPSTAIDPGEAALEALFEDAQGVRLQGATLTGEDHAGPTYYMTNRFPIMVAQPAGTQRTGTAILLDIPAPGEIVCHGVAPVPEASGTATAPVEPMVLTNILFSALHDQNGVPVGTGAAVGTVLYPSAGGVRLLAAVVPRVSAGLQVTYANDGGAFLVTDVPAGEELTVEVSAPGFSPAVSEVFVVPQGGVVLIPPVFTVPLFRRGDANGDGTVSVGDVMKTLDYIFFSDISVSCMDAMDSNDDGRVDLADPIYTIRFLFLEGDPMPPPMECGPDPTEDAGGELGCEAYPLCP